MLVIGRRKLILTAAALAAGCNGAQDSGPSPDDMAIGAENAPVTLIEYASITCPHCAEFHEAVWDQLKSNYIDTGKVRFVFREFPTAPAAVAVAGFQVARCGGANADQYFNRVGAMFEQQPALFQALQASGAQGARDKFIEFGRASNLSEQQVSDCIADPSGAERITRTVEGAQPFNIVGTPTLILNGRKLEDPSAVTYEGLSRMIDAELGN